MAQMSEDDIVWCQWVTGWDGEVVWDYKPPPRAHYDDPPPIALPDAGTYEGSHLYLPQLLEVSPDATASVLFDSPPGSIAPGLRTLVMVKMRTRGGALWVSEKHAAEIHHAWASRTRRYDPR